MPTIENVGRPPDRNTSIVTDGAPVPSSARDASVATLTLSLSFAVPYALRGVWS